MITGVQTRELLGDGEFGHETVSPELFKSVLRHHATAVTVITTGTHQPVGFCATSFTSVSLSTPLVSFCIGVQTRSWAVFRVAPRILVHVLGEGQVELARRFGQSGEAKFGPDTAWRRGPFDLPLLLGVTACLVVEAVERTVFGDHALVIGRVIGASHTVGRRPLVHHDGAFTALAV